MRGQVAIDEEEGRSEEQEGGGHRALGLELRTGPHVHGIRLRQGTVPERKRHEKTNCTAPWLPNEISPKENGLMQSSQAGRMEEDVRRTERFLQSRLKLCINQLIN